MVPAILGRLRYGFLAVAVILVGCETQSLSENSASPAEAVMAIQGKLDLATRARRAAEYHASRRDWRSARIAVTEARFAQAEAEEIRADAAHVLKAARHEHRRAVDHMIAAKREVDHRSDRKQTQIVSTTADISRARVDADHTEASRSVNADTSRLETARLMVVSTAKQEARSEKALIEIDRMLATIKQTVDQTRRAGRSGRLTRSTGSN
jgi:hypothetical protein